MAIAKDLLSRFRSISRPSLNSNSGSTYSSYAKKQQSAEDAIADNLYESGQMSAESYLDNLRIRKVRTTNTPLTVVNLDEKISKVQEKVQDAKVDEGYASGKYTTDQVLQYEKEKLGRMTAPDSAAYIQQQQKIVQLQNKVERERRAALRTSELLRISQLPDDTSATLWQKAQLYQKLSEEARLDGDVQQADNLLTQANNAQSSAKKADVNDIITGARLSVSETPGAGLGVPSVEDGSSLFASLRSGTSGGGVTGDGGPQGGTPGMTASSPVTTGYSGGQSSAVKNAMKSLDRSYQSYERLVQQKQDKQTLISKYREAIGMATGDQKTQLTIQLNNLLESDKQLDNQLSITEQGINDVVERIQEMQAKAAASAFSQEVRKNNAEATKIEDQLEKAFAKGEIGKEEYIAKGTALAQMKAQFYSQSSDVFGQYGNDASAEAYLQKAADMEEIHQQLVGVATNIDSYEPIATDPGGKVTNLFGKTLQPGDIALTNVQRLKDSGDFESNFTKDGAVYRRVYYPGQKDLVGDGFVSKAVAEELSKNATSPELAPFVYKENKPMIGPGTGKVVAVPLMKTPNGQWMTEENYQGIKTQANTALDTTLKTLEKTAPKTLLDSVKKTPATQDLFTKLLSPTGFDTSKGNTVTSAISNLGSGAKNLYENAINGVKNLFGKGKDFISSAIAGTKQIEIPSLVKKAYAADGKNKTLAYDDVIDEIFGSEADNMRRVLQGENAKRNPVAVNKNTNGSLDTGLFQINSDTFNDFMRRKGAELRALGINSYADMKDPRKNTAMAKIIHDEQGYNAWYGAPADLRSQPATPAAAKVAEVKTPVNPVAPGTAYLGDVGSRTSSYQAVTPQPKANNTVIPPFQPPVVSPSLDFGPGIQPKNIGEALSNAYDNISRAAQPTIAAVKKIAAPVVQKVQQIATPVIQKVQQAAAPAVQKASSFVSNAVNSVKNVLSKLNPFK